MSRNSKLNFPVKVSMPPGLMKSSHSGRTYIVAGCMIPVPDGTTFADIHKFVTYTPPTYDVKSWKVKSSSGNTYTVTMRNNRYSCDCAGYKFYRKCKHVKKAIDEK